MKRLLVGAALLLLVNGCAQSPKLLDRSNSLLWLEHKTGVSAINSWDIKGRIAVKSKTESGTLTLSWNQLDQDYELRFIAPFGQGTYILKGSPNYVELQGPGNKILVAATAEQLLFATLGWTLHLDGLKYWIRGIPEPGVEHSRIHLDEQGRLLGMRQSGFNVTVSRYVEKDGVSLPEKISINGDTVQLKLVIQNWKI